MRENLEVVILGNVDACRCIVLYPGKNIPFHSLIKMVKRNVLTLRNKFSAQWLPDCRYVGKRLGKITRIGRTRNQRDEKVPRSGSKYNDQNSYPADLTPT